LGLEFFEDDTPPRGLSASAALMRLEPKTGHDSGPVDLERARLSDLALDADTAHEAGARGAARAALAIAAASLALTLGGGFLAARGQPASGAALFLAGVPTTLLALSTLACAARGARGGALFALASIATLASVAAATALFAVGG